jgi:ubiquinone/menaquinone biosynthesis C-methylase UbiE
LDTPPICDLCGSSNTSTFLSGYVRSKGSFAETFLVQCHTCELVFLYPRPNWEMLAEFYPESYYHQDASSDAFMSRIERVLKDRRRGVVTVAGERLLDVGCGNGDFMLSMQNHHMTVSGVEPGLPGYLACRRRELDVKNTFLESSGFQDSSFDVITANHVLEHVPDPTSFLSTIRRLLKPSGVAIIQVPNLRSFAFMLTHEYYLHLDVPRHLFQFTERSLRAYARKVGLRVLDVRYYASIGTIIESQWLRLRHSPESFRQGRRLVQHGSLLLLACEILFLPYAILLEKIGLADCVEMTVSK